mgnify:CR=1 FL=1
MSDYSKRANVGTRLKEKVDQAHAEYLAASARFDALVKETPSGLPHPDGAMRIQQAGLASRTALQRYMWAMKRFAEYSVSGTVPDDLEP